jgi:hypothetical protein
MPIDTSPEGAELLHQPVVKPFPEPTPKKPHHADQAGDGHNHDAGTPAGVSSAASPATGLTPPPPR